MLFNILHICVFSENEMKIKIAELNEAISNFRMTISALEDMITKEESDTLVRFLATILSLEISSDVFLL